jgi:hypothetical protein
MRCSTERGDRTDSGGRPAILGLSGLSHYVIAAHGPDKGVGQALDPHEQRVFVDDLRDQGADFDGGSRFDVAMASPAGER